MRPSAPSYGRAEFSEPEVAFRDLLRADAGLGHHAAPFLDIAADALGQRRGRAGLWLDSLCHQRVPRLRRVEDLVHFPVDARDDGRTGGGRHHERRPQRGLVSGKAGFRHRRHVRQRGGPRPAAHSERAQLAGANVRKRGSNGRELHLQAAGDHVGDRLRRGLVGNMGKVDPSHGCEQCSRKVGKTGHACRPVIERAWFRFGERDEFCQAVRGQARIDHQHVGCAADQRDRREILDRIIRQVRAEAERDSVGARGCDAHRVAVGRGLGDRVGAEIAARTDTILDHDLLAQPGTEPLRQNARNDIGAAACRERHDQADRPLRPSGGGVPGLGGSGARRNHQCRYDDQDFIISEPPSAAPLPALTP